MKEGREQPPMPESQGKKVEFSSPLIREYGERVTTALAGADSKFAEAEKLIDEARENTGRVDPPVGIEATKIQEAALADVISALKQLQGDIEAQIKIMRRGRIYSK